MIAAALAHGALHRADIIAVRAGLRGFRDGAPGGMDVRLGGIGTRALRGVGTHARRGSRREICIGEACRTIMIRFGEGLRGFGGPAGKRERDALEA